MVDSNSGNVGYLSLGADYLGFLNGELRNLRGIDVLTQELIQNADDASGGEGAKAATQIIFDVRDDALVVENDGGFTDCGAQNLSPENCLWKAKYGSRCDLHRFRRTASGDKRNEEGTTGAFGFGFISVYQITDAPELRTRRHNWRIKPESTEDQRIQRFDAESDVDGTIFRFPWAMDGNSRVRQELAAQQVNPDQVDGFTYKIAEVLPHAALFLRRLHKLEVRRNGAVVRQVSIVRTSETDSVTVTTDDTTTTWRIVSGDFEVAANNLRSRYENRIEAKRQATVAIAIPPPENSATKGLLYATLPTHKESGFPFHINADFYPTTDRLDVRFTEDYQGEWNASAIRAAAQILGDELIRLRDCQGANWIWQIAEAAHALDKMGGAFGAFWQILNPLLKSGPYVQIANNEWRTASGAYLIEKSTDIETRTELLTRAEIPVTASILRSHYGLLLQMGVDVLTAAALAAELQHRGLDKTLPLAEAPEWIKSDVDQQTIAGLVESYSQNDRDNFRACAILHTLDDLLALPKNVLRATYAQQQTMDGLPIPISFADPKAPETILSLCPWLSRLHVIRSLGNVDSSRLNSVWQTQPKKWIALLSWLGEVSDEEWSMNGNQMRTILTEHPIWPSGANLRSLTELSVPGGFDDFLGIANIMNYEAVDQCQQLLDRLDARRLTIISYAIDSVPSYFQNQEAVDDYTCDILLALFEEHRDAIRQNLLAKGSLGKLPIVPCTDGIRRSANSIYFNTPLVRTLLGREIPLAEVPSSEVTSDLYCLLGVGTKPRARDIVARVQTVASKPLTEETRKLAQDILVRLSDNWEQFQADAASLDPLKTIAWLPVKHNTQRWFKPNEIYNSNLEGIFTSQANFLDTNNFIRGELRDFLGIKYEPSTKQIVDHLIDCVDKNRSVDNRVYRELQSRWENEKKTNFRTISLEESESQILRLKDVRFIQLEEAYVSSKSVFWNPTVFGQYAKQLSPEFNEFRRLFEFLGVDLDPTCDTIFKIIETISAEFGTSNIRVTPDALSVLRNCWQFLQKELDENRVSPEELKLRFNHKKVVAAPDSILRRPSELIFDDRPGMASVFGSSLEKFLLPLGEDSWKALTAIGVGLLTRSIKTRINQASGEEEDQAITARIAERQFLFRRLNASLRNNTWNLDHFENIRFYRFSNLVVIREAVVGGGTVAVTSDQPYAYYDLANRIFYHTKARSAWTDIARELLYMLDAQAEMSLTFAVRNILEPETIQDASLELDAAGIPQLQDESAGEQPQVHVATLGTTENNVPEENTIAKNESLFETTGAATVSSVSDVISLPLNSETSPIANISENQTSTVGLSANRTLGNSIEDTGDNISSRSDQSQSFGYIVNEVTRKTVTKTESDLQPNLDSDRDSITTSHRPFQPTPVRQRGRLYSYITPEDSAKNSIDASEGLKEHRDTTENAGIEAAMGYERAQGRFPREMPPNNPGYDIESRTSEEPDAVIARFIEVKAIPQQWGEKGVGITRTQFQKARESGELFWLYVVEQVLDGTPTLHTIQNPAGRVDQFFFDEGWRSAATKEQ